MNPDKQDAFYTSKQNSDASGMRYQWGRKDPFTFATNSELWETGDKRGLYPVKIYTIDGVLIYQEDTGSNNIDQQPAGGVIFSSTSATSMIETIKDPIIFYYGDNAIISQVGHAKSLWDYYWTSYSRGTDGQDKWGAIKNMKWHNDYLDGYISQRVKSIYDPCPYGFRVTSNGSYNQFRNSGWIIFSYIAGTKWSNISTTTWFPGLGLRNNVSIRFGYTGSHSWYFSSTPNSNAMVYLLMIEYSGAVFSYRQDYFQSSGMSVRCIEELCSSVRSDRRKRSVF